MAPRRVLLLMALAAVAALTVAPRLAAADRIRCGPCTCTSPGARVQCVDGTCVLGSSGAGNSATSLSIECNDGNGGMSASSSSSSQQFSSGGNGGSSFAGGNYARASSSAGASHANAATAWAMGAAASTLASVFGDAFEW